MDFYGSRTNNVKSFRPRKSLGQNFLINEHICQKIVKACQLSPHDTVLEIGPGRGELTEHILPLVNSLIAVEKDKGLADLLKKKFRNSKLTVVANDFLNYNFPPLPQKIKSESRSGQINY